MSAAAGTRGARRQEVPAGNLFDKYASPNPVVRTLMARFERSLGELLQKAAPASVLDVGCGEGVMTRAWAERMPAARVVGVDLEQRELEDHWAARRPPNLEFLAGDAGRLPFADDEFELVAAVEALEHVEAPARTLCEMARVADTHLLVSVPREPVWRALNLARGAYVRELGNTPGHRNHWSPRGLIRLLEPYGELVAHRAPLPWQVLLVRVR